FISPGLSRVMAKMVMGVQLIDSNTRDPGAQRLLGVVGRLTRSAGLPMPQVGIYDSGDPNAFATGPTRSRALVAVSSGLLQRMDDAEIEGVLGHEVTHIANGDMVTMTLLQGVMNAFVMFLSRAIAWGIAQSMRRDATKLPSYAIVIVVQLLLEVVFMFLGSMVVAWFSRQREFRADAGGARLAGREKMINALAALPFAAFMADDLFQLGALEGVSPCTWLGAWRLYTISDGVPEHVRAMQDAGAFPWFFGPDFNMAFFRPLSSALLAADHAVWGLWPVGYRFQGACWFID